MLNYSVMYSLSEKDSGSKQARNCIYLSKADENISYHHNFDVDIFFMIVRYVQLRIICSLEVHNWCEWLDCNIGK